MNSTTSEFLDTKTANEGSEDLTLTAVVAFVLLPVLILAIVAWQEAL